MDEREELASICPPLVRDKYLSYPDHVRGQILAVRRLILEVATEDATGDIEEALKWGEPAYIAKGGSAVRVDWKPKFPGQYCIYVNCKTRLVETFRELYGDVLVFEGNRAMVFELDAKLPETELKHCISLALRYHSIKHLPLLGV